MIEIEEAEENSIASVESVAEEKQIVEENPVPVKKPLETQKYTWLSFSAEKKEINYMKRFINRYREKIDPEELGIPELSGEIIENYQSGVPSNLTDVADNIMKRIRRYGELDCLYAFARRSDPKMSENDLYDNFYDQNDPFIDDAGFDKTFEARKPLMPESKIDDFFCVPGEIVDLMEKGFLGDREKLLKGIRKKSRKRDSKKRKAEPAPEEETLEKKVKESPEVIQPSETKENSQTSPQESKENRDEEEIKENTNDPITINTSIQNDSLLNEIPEEKQIHLLKPEGPKPEPIPIELGVKNSNEKPKEVSIKNIEEGNENGKDNTIVIEENNIQDFNVLIEEV